MSKRPIRIAVRGLLLLENRLLMVNAFPAAQSDLLCAPGGGAEPHRSLPDNLKREMYEETGLTVEVESPCMVNEFHDEPHGFHQVDIYFWVRLVAGDPHGSWTDPEGVVTERHWLSRDELSERRHKPDCLTEVVWGERSNLAHYDPLEPILR